MIIPLGDSIAKFGWGVTAQPCPSDHSLAETSDGNGLETIEFAASNTETDTNRPGYPLINVLKNKLPKPQRIS